MSDICGNLRNCGSMVPGNLDSEALLTPWLVDQRGRGRGGGATEENIKYKQPYFWHFLNPNIVAGRLLSPPPADQMNINL